MKLTLLLGYFAYCIYYVTNTHYMAFIWNLCYGGLVQLFSVHMIVTLMVYMSTIQLEEDHSETQRLLAQERSARTLQENLLNSHLRKQQEIEDENKRNISKSNEVILTWCIHHFTTCWFGLWFICYSVIQFTLIDMLFLNKWLEMNRKMCGSIKVLKFLWIEK